MSKPWTEFEDELLRANYPGHGKDWSIWEDILPHRSQSAIAVRAHHLGITKYEAPFQIHKWNDKERRALLIALDIARQTTHHNVSECINEAIRLVLEGGSENGNS